MRVCRLSYYPLMVMCMLVCSGSLAGPASRRRQLRKSILRFAPEQFSGSGTLSFPQLSLRTISTQLADFSPDGEQLVTAGLVGSHLGTFTRVTVSLNWRRSGKFCNCSVFLDSDRIAAAWSADRRVE